MALTPETKRWLILPARISGISQQYMPRSRREFRQALQQGMQQDETYYRAALAGLYPQHEGQLQSLRPNVVADLLVDAVFSGEAIITDEPPDQRILLADAGLLTVAGGLALLDGPLPVGDILAAGVIIIGGSYLLMQNISGSRTLTRAEETTIVDELIDRSCSARNGADALNCWMFFHYTTPAGFENIMAAGVIFKNRSGIVYLTWLPLSPEDVRTTLVFGQGNEGKGDYVIAFSKKPGVTFFPGESFNELKHRGSLRFNNHINVIYAGPNPLP